MSKIVRVAGLTLLLLGLAPAASADIIVVNGKIAQEGGDAKATDCRTLKGQATAPKSVTCAPATGGDTRPVTGTKPGSTQEEGEEEGQNLDSVPDGWVCQNIGGGIEMCQPAEDGSQPPIKGGGSAADSGEMVVPDDPMNAAGCQGGGAAGPWALLLSILALLGFAVRRRAA